jgi:hypothetical protein
MATLRPSSCRSFAPWAAEIRGARTLACGRVLAELEQRHHGARDEQRGGHPQRAPPAQRVDGRARDDVRERGRDLISGADDPDRASALGGREPVRRDAHRGRPTQGLCEAVARPHEHEERQAGAEPEREVQRGRAEHADREHALGRDVLGHLAVHELTDAVDELRGAQDHADLGVVEVELGFDAGHRRRDVRATEVECTVGQRQHPRHAQRRRLARHARTLTQSFAGAAKALASIA